VLRLDWAEEEVFAVASLAHALYEQGCHAEALVLFEGLIEIAPDDGYCREAAGAVALALGLPQQAIEHLSALLAFHPDHAGARARRAEAYIEARDFAAARADLELLRRTPAHAAARRLEMRLEAALARHSGQFPGRAGRGNFPPPVPITGSGWARKTNRSK
jgi:predicted Zn-dependent protease